MSCPVSVWEAPRGSSRLDLQARRREQAAAQSSGCQATTTADGRIHTPALERCSHAHCAWILRLVKGKEEFRNPYKSLLVLIREADKLSTMSEIRRVLCPQKNITVTTLEWSRLG